MVNGKAETKRIDLVVSADDMRLIGLYLLMDNWSYIE